MLPLNASCLEGIESIEVLKQVNSRIGDFGNVSFYVVPISKNQFPNSKSLIKIMFDNMSIVSALLTPTGFGEYSCQQLGPDFNVNDISISCADKCIINYCTYII